MKGVTTPLNACHDPLFDRWSTVDPMAESSYSQTPYKYCNNNPENYIDPDGRSETDGNVTGWDLYGNMIHNPGDSYETSTLYADYEIIPKGQLSEVVITGDKNLYWANQIISAGKGNSGIYSAQDRAAYYNDYYGADLATTVSNFAVSATGTFVEVVGQGWKSSSNASQWSSANKIAKSLEDTGIKLSTSAIKNGIPKVLSKTGKFLGAAAGAVTVAEIVLNSQLNASNVLDASITAASFIPVVGWAIGGGYFVANMVTLGVTGQSIGEHLDSTVGGPLVDW